MERFFAAGGRRPGYGGAVLWKGSTSAVEDLTRAPSCGNGVFERICIRFTSEWSSVTATIANLHLASNRFALDGQGKLVLCRSPGMAR